MKPKPLFNLLVALELVLGLIYLGWLSLTTPAQAQGGDITAQAIVGTAFTYQGRLMQNNAPVNGTCNLTFRLYNAATAGSQVGSDVSNGSVAVNDGYFTQSLDFGSGVFTGEARWLEITINSCNGSGSPVMLNPRVALNPAPYAHALPGLWTEQNPSSPNIIGGYSGNSVTSGAVGATIGGGGANGIANRVTDHFGTVAGGYNNQAGNNAGAIDDAPHAFVGGGGSNTANSFYAAVVGGWGNVAGGDNAAIGGGQSNTASGDYTAICGGANNVVSATRGTIAGGGYLADPAYGNRVTDEGGFVGGGGNNQAGDNAGAETDAYYAVVAGGWSNTAGNKYAFVGGGDTNTASGVYAAVPGGQLNVAAGDYSFAAGRQAKANSQGCFVWGDSNSSDVSCDNVNRWVARAGGGVYFYTNSALSSGMFLSSSGSSWNAVSNRNLKENFRPVDRQELLARLADIEITTWNYKAQPANIRHIGPMADEFNALTKGLGGEGQDYINTLDADGVALAAIQGLYDLAQQQQARIAELESRLTELEAKQ